MSEEKTTDKTKTAKAKSSTAAKKKAAPKKEVAKAKPAAPAKKPATGKSKKIPTGKVIKVTQTGSPIGRQEYQEQTLVGLGLNKRHRTKILQDTPAVRGMIEKVKHLVKVEDAA